MTSRYWNDEMKEGNMGSTCSMHGREDKSNQIFLQQNLKGRNLLKDLGIEREDKIKMDLLDIE